MIQYKKGLGICLLQYTLMMVLHLVYALLFASEDQARKVVIWTIGVFLFLSINTLLFYKKEFLLTCITFVSIICSAYYLGVVLHTLAFAMVMYLVTELIVSLYLNKLNIILFGVLSTLTEISFIIFYPDVLLEMVPSLFLYGCYIVCYILGVINIYFLVSSARKYLSQMNIKAEEAQIATEHKSQFLANVSHEIRTPMNVICGMTFMLENEELNEQAREYTENIDRASKVLLSLINNILDLSTIESGKYVLQAEEYNLNQFVDDVENLISVKANVKKIKLKTTIEENVPEFLVGDVDRIKQILINVLNNAVKFTDEGEINFKISVEALREPSQILLKFEISDTGTGIKKEDLEHLFESFERFDMERNRRVEGTGLGLSICKNLVNLMNGGISVESTYGEGTTFYIYIPQGASDAEHIDNSGIEEVDDTWKAPKASVLVVDDMRTNLLVAKGLLEFFGISADCAGGGKEAIEMMEKKKYDLVFLDQMMPALSGEEALHKMRAHEGENFEGIPVVVLTANVAIGGREEFINRGFSEYLSKPIELKELEKVLKQFIKV